MQTLFLKSLKEAVKHWYIPLIVGILFVIVSIIVFVSPAGSLLALAILFSISFILVGLSEIIFSAVNRNQIENWGWSLAFGIITLLAGILLLINPAISITTLAFFIGFVILFRSVASISFALDVKKYGSPNWGWLMLFGLLGALLAFILIWNPLFAGIGIVIFIALNFLSAGLFSIVFSFQLRRLHKTFKELSSDLKIRFDELADDIRKEWNENN